jgi:hypothetical protein
MPAGRTEMATNSKPSLFNSHAFDAEERSVDPAVVKEATGNLLAALNWFHGDDEIDRDVRHGHYRST